ncbi:MAG: tetratricopeptide repeat protein [Pseudomonadota bacterium]
MKDHAELKRLLYGNDISAAIALANSLIADDPLDEGAHEILGHCHMRMNERNLAIQDFHRCLELNPKNASVLSNLGTLYARLKIFDKALFYLQEAATLQPDNKDILHNIGQIYVLRNEFFSAAPYFARCLALYPNHINALYGLAKVAASEGRHTDACTILHNALTIDPLFAKAYSFLAECYQILGQVDDALLFLKKAIALFPANHLIVDAYLFALHTSELIDKATLFNEHKRVSKDAYTFGAPRLRDSTKKSPEKVRIGYVSPDFKTHSVAYFTRALFEHYDRSKFELYMYRANAKCDQVTDLFAGLSTVHRDISALDDESAYELIEKDKCDLLFDLAGHTAGNRLNVFALKPAPLTITYIGYPNTTGLPNMDYRITDPIADPIGVTDELHTERLVRLPTCFLCYTPPSDAPSLSPSPYIKKKYITFASFNKFTKITDSTIHMWKRILELVPNSRLAIKSPSNISDQSALRLCVRCKTLGIDVSRIDILPSAPTLVEHLNVYNFVDIALDSYPYNGTTTTFESLWMGVPVITLMGDHHVARVGASILTHTGLDAFIAETRDSYIERACTLANDTNTLTNLRRDLRSRLSSLPAANGSEYMQHFERACIQMHENADDLRSLYR